MFDVNVIRTATFVRHVEVHDTLASTNNRAVELARHADIELPLLVVARNQTSGRGRGTKVWWSADGALTCSLLVNSAAIGVSAAMWPQLSLTTAVAVCDVLQQESPHANVGIKWPNDVLLDGKKICGILIESPAAVALVKDRLIIGIGINVNNSWADAPADAGGRGVALCDVTGRRHPLQGLLQKLLCALHARLEELRRSDLNLKQQWQRLDLLAGHKVAIVNGGRCLAGTSGGIESDGALAVDTGSRRERFYSGTVRQIS